MKKSKKELTRIQKEKCRELKEIRARMAEDLGIELHQRECTYEGYCSGTCPACRKEELQINAALLKKQMEETNLKGRIAAAGLTTMAALCLTGCNTSGQPTEGAMDIGSANLNDNVAGFISPEQYESNMIPSDDASVNDSPVHAEDDAPQQDMILEGEILPETSEDPAQSSYEIPETYEYMEVEGDFAIPETDDM